MASLGPREVLAAPPKLPREEELQILTEAVVALRKAAGCECLPDHVRSSLTGQAGLLTMRLGAPRLLLCGEEC